MSEPSAALATPEGYRVRFRFRLEKAFHSDELVVQFAIDNILVELKSDQKDQCLRQAKWVILSANGFETEEDARKFGIRLKHAVQLSSVCNRLGVDCGRDIPTSGWGAMIKDVYLAQGVILRDDVHGIDVYKYDPRVSYLKFNMNMQVHASLEKFIAHIIKFSPSTIHISERTRDILLLLNNVLTNPHPVAQIVLAISTVEMLGQDKEWTPEQRKILDQFVELATSSDLPSKEREEIADAVRRNMYRVGLRQGVLALLSSIGLTELKKEWDAVYAERSKLVHSIAPVPGVDYTPLAHRTVNLCGRILLRIVEQEVSGLEEAARVCYV